MQHLNDDILVMYIDGELDAQTIRTNALSQAWGLETEGISQSMTSKMASKAAGMGAVGSLLSMAPKAYSAGQTSGWWK